MSNESTNKRKYISKYLRKLGISPDLLGFTYIEEALVMCGDDNSINNGFCSIIYPAIAEKFNTTPPRVERAMRKAIESMVLKCDDELYSNVFGYIVSADKGKPTNKQFIFCLLEEFKYDDEYNQIVD